MSKIDGLNIIADYGLAVDKTLTVIAKEVPLREIFDYIERNMGLAFHYGQNIVWVSQGEAEDIIVLAVSILVSLVPLVA